jgi:HSP90 family molecular chaperone
MKLISIISTLCTLAYTLETYSFQSETSRLMEIIINSLYSEKEVFLRELVSNAIDANDKIRFMALTDESLRGLNPELSVKISFNQEEKTLTIKDTGVGMSKDELVSNLGTLAKSGTTAFLEQIQAGNMNLIGQFGVGFYSAFLVADTVEVHTRKFDNLGHKWTSSASNEFHIEELGEIDYGTSIILHLKEVFSSTRKPISTSKPIN